jgi:D-serine deaminase-like pyridoxal phosphate-dependent protein
MIRPGTMIEALDTPVVLIDLDKVEANLRRGAQIAAASGVSLRPHTKTHKSPYFAGRQLAHGAQGITVAKVGEAEVMAQAGQTDIFIANTIFGATKAERVAALVAQVRMAVGVDHLEQARGLSAAMSGAPRPLEIMIEVDTGSHRGGVDAAEVVALAQAVAALPGLLVRGIYTYEGYTAGAADAGALAAIQHEAQESMVRLGGDLGTALGIRPVISVGSTPGLLSGAGYRQGITEIRPGTYIYLDASLTGLAGGQDHCAAHVLATVVSRPGPGRAVLDAGSKSLTSDTRPSGLGKTQGNGLLVDYGLTIARLSEEHGVVEGEGADRLSIGQKVRVLPNHICPVINLFDEVVAVRNGQVEMVLPVAARGRLQ